MAELLAVRERAKGAEIVIRHNGRVFDLWWFGYTPGDDITAWATPKIVAILAADAAEEVTAAAIADKLTPANVDAFIAWLKTNRLRVDVKPHLLTLARIYYEEVING